MRAPADLESVLRRIDGKGYPAYRDLVGGWSLPARRAGGEGRLGFGLHEAVVDERRSRDDQIRDLILVTQAFGRRLCTVVAATCDQSRKGKDRRDCGESIGFHERQPPHRLSIPRVMARGTAGQVRGHRGSPDPSARSSRECARPSA